MRIVFAGTPDIAATVLTALVQSPLHEVAHVFTQPDRPAGRGRKLQPGPVKQLAMQHDIPVLQPEKFDQDAQQALQAIDADLMVVVAYGLILPQTALAIPKYGCWNVHVSLLPRWRGAAPIQRAIEAGDSKTGVTIMQMDAGLDTGDILLTQSAPITHQDTAQTLHDRLAALGAEALLQALAEYKQIKPTPQPNEGVTYAEKIQKSEGALDWSLSAQVLSCKVRAFHPWPVCYADLDGQRIRIWQAQAMDMNSDQPAGSILQADKAGIQVATGSGVLNITEIQLPGSKRMQVAECIHNYHELFKVGRVWQ